MKELVIRVTQDSFDKTSRWLEVSHNGGAAWSTVLIHNDEEALQIINALQQSVQADGAYCTCQHIERPPVDKASICFSCHQPRR